jgi:putative endonuclease
MDGIGATVGKGEDSALRVFEVMNPLDRIRTLTQRFQAAFSVARHDRERGYLAETLAQQWLTAEGLEVVAQNLVTPAGEIDLICLDGDVLCVVEVKARTSDRYGPAIEALTPQKRARLARAAAWLSSSLPWHGALRFDVLTLDQADRAGSAPKPAPTGFGPEVGAEAKTPHVDHGWAIQYYRGAFEAPSEGEREREDRQAHGR